MGLEGGASADTLDPALASASVSFVIGHCWGDTLIESDPKTGEALPSLAESWSPSADAKVWTFKIRKDVHFHDGKPLTVTDAVETLRRHAGAKSQSGALGLLSGIDRIDERAGDIVGRAVPAERRARKETGIELRLRPHQVAVEIGGDRRRRFPGMVDSEAEGRREQDQSCARERSQGGHGPRHRRRRPRRVG